MRNQPCVILQIRCSEAVIRSEDRCTTEPGRAREGIALTFHRQVQVDGGRRFAARRDLTDQLLKAVAVCVVLACLGAAVPSQSVMAQTAEELQACMVRQMTLAPGNTTIDQLRNQCAELLAEQAGPTGQAALEQLDTEIRPGDVPADESTAPTAPERRFGSELAILDNPFAITAHRPNYWLFAAYNSNINEEPFEREFDREVNIDHVESKFQISLKFPIARGLFDGRANIMGAYTNRSFWQLYNSDSAPFRETNHEPELWVSLLNDWEVFGWRNAAKTSSLLPART